MLKEIILRYRRIPIVGFHIAMIVLANYLAFWIRFDSVIPAHEKEVMLRMIPWLMLIRGLTFVPFQLYKGLWRSEERRVGKECRSGWSPYLRKENNGCMS